MIELKFNHDSTNIPIAMGFSEEIDERCREIVNFSAFTNYFIKREFFDEEDKTPESLTTITGILEKALNICKTEEEKIYTLFVFKNVHEHASGAIGAYEAFEEAEDDKQRKRMQMLLELAEIKALSEADERENYITPKDMFRKIRTAKDNMYNFEDYFKNLKNESKN